MAFSLCPTLVNSQMSECWPQSVESPSLSTHLDFFPGYSPNTTHAPIPSFKDQKIYYYAMPQYKEAFAILVLHSQLTWYHSSVIPCVFTQIII